MATTVASAATTAARAAPEIASQAAARLKPAHWVCNMPTRSIAQVLLRQDNLIMDHGALYQETDRLGLLRSHRHFKHCLRMLKIQKRVLIVCKGPEKPGSAKRAFSVKLTRRGQRIYQYYSGMPDKTDKDGDGERGLKDALD